MIFSTLRADRSTPSRSSSRSSNIFPKQPRHRLAGASRLLLGIAIALVLWTAQPAAALSKSRTLEQYVHTAWGADKGFDEGTVYAISQSPDGYLWLGTEHGLIRFDGTTFTPVELPVSDRRAGNAVRGLFEDTHGNLWIRLDGPRLLVYRDGVFEDAIHKYDINEAFLTAMSGDKTGNLLLWGPVNRTLHFHDGSLQHITTRTDINGIVISLLENPTGVFWLGTRDSGLYSTQNGELGKVESELTLGSMNALAPSEHGGIWIGSERGLHLWEHGVTVPLKLPQELLKAQVFALLRDHNHNLWVGTDAGLYRLDPEQEVVTGFFRSQTDPEISALFEDRDGSIWFAGSHSIERFRDGMFASYASQQPSLDELGGPLYVDAAGRAWFGPASGGLFCLENGIFRRVTIPGDNDDVIYSIDGTSLDKTRDELWLARQKGGLTELSGHGDDWSSHAYTQRDGLAQDSVYTVTRARDGSIWAGTVSGGVSVLRHGHFTTYTVKNGLPSNAIFSSFESSDKVMWFASPSGLISFDGSRWHTYAPEESDPPVYVRTVFEDAKHTLWVGTSLGIARFDQGKIRLSEQLPRALREEVLSISQDAQGFLWILTDDHIFQVDRGKLLAGTLGPNDVLTYGVDDGLDETKGVRRDRSLVSDASGRIWVCLVHSLAMADPRDAEAYRRPVRVRIETTLPESATTLSGRSLDLPQDVRSIAFQYAGTNMATPQRIQFHYRLEGLEQQWSADDASKQVVYTHLAPGSYTFRIAASNALGAWNGPENAVTIKVKPFLWETWYFQALAAVVVLCVAIALYRLRLAHVRRQLNQRFEDRLAERTRIAQDLHDTLLQGVMSASMQLDVAQDHLPEDSPAKPIMNRVLQLIRQVTEEGRGALRGLRTIDTSVSIETAFNRMAKATQLSPSATTHVYVQGDSRMLKPAVFDEVYRIGREAYRNAIAHAAGSRIEILVEYGSRSFRMRVRDDGCGIDPMILRHGREGHWGLAGMKERADAIGSSVDIHTRTPGGTDVELRIPAAIAYDTPASRRMRWPFPIRRRYPELERKQKPE